jgi:hypothetical protein
MDPEMIILWDRLKSKAHMVERLIELSFIRNTAGVYFLLDENDMPVYVGSSKDLASRSAQHSDKVIYKVACLFTHPDDRFVEESLWINALRLEIHYSENTRTGSRWLHTPTHIPFLERPVSVSMSHCHSFLDEYEGEGDCVCWLDHTVNHKTGRKSYHINRKSDKE